MELWLGHDSEERGAPRKAPAAGRAARAEPRGLGWAGTWASRQVGGGRDFRVGL